MLHKNNVFRRRWNTNPELAGHLMSDHLTFRSLNQLVTQENETSLPKLSMLEKMYEGDFDGKQPRNSFKSHLLVRSSSVLEVVHSDICGPFEVTSLGGNKYFISFVDKYNRRFWVYLIKFKDEVFESVQKIQGTG